MEGAERIAEAVAKYDIDRFIHVSSYNASLDSPSEFFRTKARGEQVVRDIFPETTIVRPAPMWGYEDRLLHRLAGVTNLFTVNNLQERSWPVHVRLSCQLPDACANFRSLTWAPRCRRCWKMTLPRHRRMNYSVPLITPWPRLPSSLIGRSSSVDGTSMCQNSCYSQPRKFSTSYSGGKRHRQTRSSANFSIKPLTDLPRHLQISASHPQSCKTTHFIIW